MSYNRKYTVTVKPVKKELQNKKKHLFNVYDKFLQEVSGQSNYHVLEKEGTPDLHLHGIISCPLIKSKRLIAKKYPGYHFHMELILYRDYDNIEDIWMKYTQKEKSDADRYMLLYGPSIPLNDNPNYLTF